MQFFNAVNRPSEYYSTLLFNIKTADAADRMTERFRQLFERGDVTGMGEELYREQVPSDDERLLQLFFGRAEQMQAELEQPAIHVVGSSATADVFLERVESR